MMYSDIHPGISADMNAHTARILALMDRMPVVDMHSDYAIELYRRELAGQPHALHEEHLPALRQGRVRMEVLTVGGDFDIDTLLLWDPHVIDGILATTLRQIGEEREFHLVRTRTDLPVDDADGDISFMLALEGIRGVRDLDDLRRLHARGVRAVILTHNERNHAADGCAASDAGGLSEFGRDVLRTLEELHMVLDLVHLSDASFWDAIERWPFAPVVSHSNARTLRGHRRNLTDDQIREIGRRDGVIGLNFLAQFVDVTRASATPDRLADHAVHIASLAGPQCLGLGPDYADYYMDAMRRWIARDQLPADTMDFITGAEDVRGLPVFVEALATRGFTDAELLGILGGNARRVYASILTTQE